MTVVTFHEVLSELGYKYKENKFIIKEKEIKCNNNNNN